MQLRDISSSQPLTEPASQEQCWASVSGPIPRSGGGIQARPNNSMSRDRSARSGAARVGVGVGVGVAPGTGRRLATVLRPHRSMPLSTSPAAVCGRRLCTGHLPSPTARLIGSAGRSPRAVRCLRSTRRQARRQSQCQGSQKCAGRYRRAVLRAAPAERRRLSDSRQQPGAPSVTAPRRR